MLVTCTALSSCAGGSVGQEAAHCWAGEGQSEAFAAWQTSLSKVALTAALFVCLLLLMGTGLSCFSCVYST